MIICYTCIADRNGHVGDVDQLHPPKLRLGDRECPAEQPSLPELEFILNVHDVETVMYKLIEEVEPEEERQEPQEMSRAELVDGIGVVFGNHEKVYAHAEHDREEPRTEP